jgi:hypothetical protein
VCDMFGKSINLNFSDKESYTTAMGGFFSLAFLTLIIVFFWSSVIKKYNFQFYFFLKHAYNTNLISYLIFNLLKIIFIIYYYFLFSICFFFNKNKLNKS